RIRVLLPTDQVVSLPLQQYLASVVSSELPAHWPAAAVEAQAVASRTYAIWSLTPDRPFDVTSTVSNQVFGATARPGALTAVSATHDQVLIYQGKIIPAYFHACSLTWTANNEDVWPGPPLPFLRAIDDVAPNGQPYGQSCPYQHWQAGPFSTEELSRLLAADPRTAVGNLQTLTYGPRDQGGRLEWVKLQGDAGTKTVPAAIFRMVINEGQRLSHTLLSADFQVVPAPSWMPRPQPVPPLPPPTTQSVPMPASSSATSRISPRVLPSWVLTTAPATPLRTGPSASTTSIVALPTAAPLLVLGSPSGSWLPVHDPANGRAGYVATGAVLPWNPSSSAGTAATPTSPPSTAPASASFSPFWVENFVPARLWSGTNGQAVVFGSAPQWTAMEVLRPAVNGRYLVLVWTTHNIAYINGQSIGPAGPP
ncbi:MAG: SpoIID/LytB domain-containing protein, partial [Chloroflexi bacterium]|nr:SpoIID/LytB domain-containing protein [Chloroflexota bacterium]